MVSKLRRKQFNTFALTFCSYAMFTAGRIPYSVTKPMLKGDGTDSHPGWAPFNDAHKGDTYLGMLDSVFLVAYAAGLFFSGGLGDRLNLRYFLAFGMVASGFALAIYGMAEAFEIHSLYWFVGCNILSGLFQSIGWPSNVTLMSRWFSPTIWGTIMGVWSAQASCGLITFKQIDAYLIRNYTWGDVFLVSGMFMAINGLCIFFWLDPEPQHVLSKEEMHVLKNSTKLCGTESVPTSPVIGSLNSDEGGEPLIVEEAADSSDNANYPLSVQLNANSVAETDLEELALTTSHVEEHEQIPFLTAIRIPGVLAYAMALFFTKLVAYAFVFWLPSFLTQFYSDSTATSVSSFYDGGGIFGGFLCGVLADKYGKKGVVCVGFIILTAIMLYFYTLLAPTSWNIPALVMLGVLVNGPYTLISSAVSADLGNHPSLRGNPTAMSTVTGFIDGVGTIGAIFQGIGVGLLSDNLDWNVVFYCLIGAALISAACLITIVRAELRGPKYDPLSQHS